MLLLNMYTKNFKKKSNPGCKLVYTKNQFIEKEGQMEFWWNVSITTPAKVKHNKPDLVIWCCDTKTCKIVEFSCPVDVDVTKKIQEKEDNYVPFYACYKKHILDTGFRLFLLL